MLITHKINTGKDIFKDKNINKLLPGKGITNLSNSLSDNHIKLVQSLLNSRNENTKTEDGSQTDQPTDNSAQDSSQAYPSTEEEAAATPIKASPLESAKLSTIRVVTEYLKQDAQPQPQAPDDAVLTKVGGLHVSGSIYSTMRGQLQLQLQDDYDHKAIVNIDGTDTMITYEPMSLS